MMVRRLGGVYFESTHLRNCVNPLSSTMLTGSKSMTIIFTSALSIVARLREFPS